MKTNGKKSWIDFTDKSLRKLRNAIATSYKALSKTRNHRAAAIKQHVGCHYGEGGATQKNIMNYLELGISSYVPSLVSANPAASITTPFKQLKPHASSLSLAVNYLINEINLKETLELTILNALFAVGIIKVGITEGKNIEVNGVTHDIGQPFADSVDFEDWIQDTTARSYEEMQFMGNIYRLPYEYVMDTDMFNKEAKGNLKADNSGDGQSGNGLSPDTKVKEILAKSNGEDGEFHDAVTLMDIFLPMENLFLTLPVMQEGKALIEREWDGPECGPFHMLGFGQVVNNALPLAPVMVWQDIHELGEKIWNKIGNQALRQKTITGVRRGAEDDANRVIDANDGEVVAMDGNPAQDVAEFKYGGADQVNFALAIKLNQLFSYEAGNLDALAGLAPQSGTLGQDEMLLQSASKRVQFMQGKTVDMTSDVMKSLAWYLFYDPMIKIPITKRVGNTGIEVTSIYTPEDREGDFLDYNFTIEPYSMQPMTPQSKLAIIDRVFNGYLAPFAQMMEAQGVRINWSELIRTIIKLSNVRELEDILMFDMPAAVPEEGPIGSAPRKMQNTTRRYERVNRPGATKTGGEEVLVNNLLGKQMQPAQQEGMMRNPS